MRKYIYLLASVLLIFIELLNTQEIEVLTFGDKFTIGATSASLKFGLIKN